MPFLAIFSHFKRISPNLSHICPKLTKCAQKGEKGQNWAFLGIYSAFIGFLGHL
jgi:hypothetical protein